uniref:Uncharacterized protein n=1 Tax=Zosterops lateralis melanops TaxID=1220523 RepID=A0A8D2Q1Y5_ZOSLA
LYPSEEKLERFGPSPEGELEPGELLGALLPGVSAGVLKTQGHRRETWPPFAITGSPLLPSIPGRSIKGVAMNLTAELGPIQIRNGSIVIPCDGLYLVSLKSSIYLEEESWLKLTLRGTHETSSALWEQIVQSSDRTVNLTTVLYLFQQDSITLWTNSNASIRDLSFSLVLITHIQRNPGFLSLLDSICV